MIRLRSIAVGGILMLALAGTAHAQIGARLVETGEFSVDCPRPDFGWALIKEGGQQQAKVRIYACGKKDDPSGLLLTVDSRPASTDAQRRSTVTTHFDALIESLKADGFTDLKARHPEVGGKVPDRVAFDIEGKDAEGKLQYVYVQTVFGRAVYTFQAVAGSDPAAQKLIATAGTLKELK